MAQDHQLWKAIIVIQPYPKFLAATLSFETHNWSGTSPESTANKRGEISKRICCKENGDSVVLLYFCRPPLTRSNLQSVYLDGSFKEGFTGFTGCYTVVKTRSNVPTHQTRPLGTIVFP
ncbi:hypothetical protein E2C01_025652 [Portunus trituberculatus]|uniref:Uncharacterized protein n=1 Tax=Portunus trituberculatus TaxID=210409 RepID=A0A5B7EH12_PORTR|nr:hypothetical protein [Portunus trituberculatus]